MSKRRAFTLIELLVVIAIIGLLLAMLLPSLTNSRRLSMSTVCQTHLRQLAYGWHMYADDNNDVILPGRFFKVPGGTGNPDNYYHVGNGLKYRPRWVAAMGGRVGIFAFEEPSTTDDRQDYTSQVYQCPTAPEWIDERNYAYGYNHQFLGNARKTADQFHNFPVNRSALSMLASTVLAADCLGTAAGLPEAQRLSYNNNGTDFSERGNHGWTLDPPRLTANSDRGTGDAGSPRTGVDPRHLRKVNVAYCDGHIESQTPTALGYRIGSDGTYLDGEEGPNPASNLLFSGHRRDDDPPPLPR